VDDPKPLDDAMKAGPLAIINNLRLLLPALGVADGAAAATIAGIGCHVIHNHWDELMEAIRRRPDQQCP
jgi:hypothetical protein